MITAEKKKRAQRARNKTALYGLDIDVDRFAHDGSAVGTLKRLDDLSEMDRAVVSQVAFDPDQKAVAGSYLQIDHELILAEMTLQEEGLEILPINEALMKHDWLSDYLWNAVLVDADKYTATSELEKYDGYFIRAKPGVKVKIPIQSCMLMRKNRSLQNIHNIIIAEEGSELHVVNGCTSLSTTQNALHLGVSEFYVGKNAKLSFTMVHRWSEAVDVRPRSATIVSENGIYIENYAILSPIHSIQSYPQSRLTGMNAKADLTSVVYGSKDSRYDVGGLLTLEAPGANGFVVARAVATDRADITSRGDIIGMAPGTKGRLECDSLLLSDESKVDAIPRLEALHRDCVLSHEATVGKIGNEQLEYLMSRGFNEDKAAALIVSGFVSLDIPGLPPTIQRVVDETIRMALDEGSM
jgi:Fe-S cluster assembly scaffold protein SufB